MAEIKITHKASDDLDEIKESISEGLLNPAAAENTILKIMRAIRRLEDFPEIGAPLSSIAEIPNNYRFLVCGNYLVFYRFQDDIVRVVRVIYGKRDYMKTLFGDAAEEKDST